VPQDRRSGILSGGTRTKLGLALALAPRPPLLLLDEPTAGLDPLMIEAFCQTVTELRAAGHTIFLSSHVLSEVERLCDRIALVASGRLVKAASVGDVRREFPRRVSVTFTTDMAAPPVVEGVTVLHVSAREWRFETKGELGALLARIDNSRIADVQIEAFRLEDYILRLYEDRR
jgi:ABC-2 type transport system ATP-binding protein